MAILKKTLLFVSCSSLLLCASINISVAVTRAEYDDVQAYTVITPPTSGEGCSEFSSTVYYGDSYFNGSPTLTSMTSSLEGCLIKKNSAI